jgi:hypothetical protein
MLKKYTYILVFSLVLKKLLVLNLSLFGLTELKCTLNKYAECSW